MEATALRETVNERLKREASQRKAARAGRTRRNFLKAAGALVVAEAADQVTGGNVTRTVIESVRELTKAEPTEVYEGELTIPLAQVEIFGQDHENSSRLEGTVNPKYVKKFNGQAYNQEKFLVVKNGVIVEGKDSEGKTERMLQVKIDDNNLTGQYYSYIPLSEKAQLALGKLDESKFAKVSSRNISTLILQNGQKLQGNQLNVTSFR